MPIIIEGKPKVNRDGSLLIIQEDGKVIDVGETISRSADWNSKVTVLIAKAADGQGEFGVRTKDWTVD